MFKNMARKNARKPYLNKRSSQFGKQLSPTAQSIAKPLVSGKYCNNNGYEKINHTQPCKQNIKKTQ